MSRPAVIPPHHVGLSSSPTAGLVPGAPRFPGGVGNTQQDAARFTSLIDDVERRLFDALPDSTWVYPGHGGDTTLGAERPHLAEWRARGW
jgi:glyoxylase-like metal-dependent hydrolase (beta-lactamase superfamily II)